jgi:hypothetical protein
MAFFSISACEFAPLFTMSFITDARAESTDPGQPVAPPGHQEDQNAPQPPLEQTGQTPPEAPVEETTQPLPGEHSTEQKQPAPVTPEKPEEIPKETTIVDVVHGEISRRILLTATWLDSFFGDQRYAAERNQSYVRFRYNVFLEDKSPAVLKPELQVRIVLPQLREKTRLEISGVPSETPDLSAIESSSPASDQFTTTGERNVTTSVNYLFRETAQENFIVRAGIKFHRGAPVTLVGPRYRVLFPLNRWNLRFIEDLAWRSDTGWQAKTSVDLERPLPHELFFRATNEWIRTAHVNGYLYSFSFTLLHPLSLRRALSYEWVNIFQTRPVSELVEVDLRIRYRQRILRDWLFFEVAPQYRFPRDRGFEATPGILFRLEAMFGRYR